MWHVAGVFPLQSLILFLFKSHHETEFALFRIFNKAEIVLSMKSWMYAVYMNIRAVYRLYTSRHDRRVDMTSGPKCGHIKCQYFK